MDIKTQHITTHARLEPSLRARFTPVEQLSPTTLGRVLDNFQAGYLAKAALLWDSIERRDDILQGVASKRKKSVARLQWDILTTDSSEEAQAHKAALENLYENIQTTHACDSHQVGGIALLIKQMMDAVGKKYAVHEITWQPIPEQPANQLAPGLHAHFRFVPLWYFENTQGRLKFVGSSATSGPLQAAADAAVSGRKSAAKNPGVIELKTGEWMVTTAEGLMESCSIAYLFKHLPLRDWLIYCERNGMPGVKGTTDAPAGSAEWEAARDAVRDFGAEFRALMGRGTEIEAIDLSSRAELPYPKLVERMDRAMIALWRGADLGTISNNGGVGSSVQTDETALLEQDDAALISETLHAQVDRTALKYLFGDVQPKARFRLKARDASRRDDLQIYKTLWEMGLPIPLKSISERFGIRINTQENAQQFQHTSGASSGASNTHTLHSLRSIVNEQAQASVSNANKASDVDRDEHAFEVPETSTVA